MEVSELLNHDDESDFLKVIFHFIGIVPICLPVNSAMEGPFDYKVCRNIEENKISH